MHSHWDSQYRFAGWLQSIDPNRKVCLAHIPCNREAGDDTNGRHAACMPIDADTSDTSQDEEDMRWVGSWVLQFCYGINSCH